MGMHVKKEALESVLEHSREKDVVRSIENQRRWEKGTERYLLRNDSSNAVLW